jgi:hypothetical protein
MLTAKADRSEKLIAALRMARRRLQELERMQVETIGERIARTDGRCQILAELAAIESQLAAVSRSIGNTEISHGIDIRKPR